ncbi:methyltransferase GidB [Streptococcus mitis]|uniref:Methyltransferase GidB n=1 Tax=Streptococcus mitis TaxID=28037 RepID=A0A081PRQ6_STRMT|nr:methyltransferase GidB [Streptococcus mitis]
MKPETFYNLLAEQNLSLSDQQKNNLNVILSSWLNGMKRLI